MLKKLKEMIYNREQRKELKDVEFENFSSYGKLPYPFFYSKMGNSNFNKPFVPESEAIFKLSIEKLSLEYFKRVSIEDFKSRVEKFCDFFHFDESVITYCLNIYKAKQEIMLSKNTSNNI